MCPDWSAPFPSQRPVPFRSLVASLAVLALVLPAARGSAELLEIDLVSGSGDAGLTRDTATGLDWLDLDRTDNLSIPLVEAGAGDWTALGFRVATISEVLDLHAQFGLVSTFGEPRSLLIEMAPRALEFRAFLGCSEIVCLAPDRLDDTTFSRALARGDTERPSAPDFIWVATIKIFLGDDPLSAMIGYGQIPEDSLELGTSVYLVRDVAEPSLASMLVLLAGLWLCTGPAGGGGAAQP